MTGAAATPLTGAAAAIAFGGILLTPCAFAGLALINAGLGRSRNVAHSLLSALCVMAVAWLAYFAVGFAWQAYPGAPSHVVFAGGKPWSWIGAGHFLLWGVDFEGSPAPLFFLFGMAAAGLAAIVPLGAAAERWRLGASCASSAVLGAFTYPVFAHWAWGGGWLEQLGINYGIGRGYMDAGGSGPIHALGGLTALSMAWILGPRRGKYHAGGMPAAIPAHNSPFVLFGCFLAWFGFLGLDSAGAILFSGVPAPRVTLVAVNVALSAATALLAAAIITHARFGKTDASLCANAWVGGLVAISAGCAVIRPAGAVVIGFIAGALITLSVGWLELYLKLDDPGGAISVHGLGGIWGVLAVGIFGQSGTGPDQWLAQVVGISTLIGFVLPIAYGTNWLLDRFLRHRVAPEGERQGLDLYELGAGAYPDFMTHTDDY